jgi:hypothetical protein
MIMAESTRLREERMSGPLRLAAGSLALLLAGCTGVWNPYYYGNFEPSEAVAVKVAVAGEPVAGSTDLPQNLVRAMRGHTAFPTELSLLAPGERAPYRTVVAFNPQPGVSTWLLCYEPLRFGTLPAGAAGAGAVPVTAALCRGDQILSGAYGYIERVPPQDPRFQVAMAQLTETLFPPTNPDAQNFGGGSAGVNP